MEPKYVKDEDGAAVWKVYIPEKLSSEGER